MSALAARVARGVQDVPKDTSPRQTGEDINYATQRDILEDEALNLLEGADAALHGADIRFIMDVAMNEFGVRTESDFIRFRDEQLLAAERSGMIEGDGKHWAAAPVIEQLADYLRFRKSAIGPSG